VKQRWLDKFNCKPSGLALYSTGINRRNLSGRNKRGAIIYLYIAIAFAVIALFMFGSRVLLLLTERGKYQQALESAAMRASVDISEIVINDPYFGFISLSDQRAIGRTTMAGDGEPLPVHGINTIIATTRLDYIIAQETGDGQLEQLALEDMRHAREAAIQLDKVLERALSPNSNDAASVPRDMDGNEVHAYADALSMYEKSLQSFTTANPEGFKLTLGWLRNGTQTITPIPVSNSLSKKERERYVKAGTEINGYYRAYVDIPVGNEHFSFAGLGTEPTLVSATQFVPKRSQRGEDDTSQQQKFIESRQYIPEINNRYLSSIVRAESVWQLSNLFSGDKDKAPETLASQACAQPYAVISQPAPSIFVMAFPDGCPSEINSMADILHNRGLNNATMNVYTPVRGDFPVDPLAYLQPSNNGMTQVRATAAFAQAFYDWLRSNYALPKVDAILGALSQPLGNGAHSAFSYIFVAEITAEGNVIISALNANPFADIRINENQFYAINATPALIGGSNWTVVCRDQVHTMGTFAGGKHAGQPMPGDPVNWSELSLYVNNAFAAAVADRKPGGITLSGQICPGGAIALTGSQLLCDDGAQLPRSLRKSAYSGGLGIEVRISSPLAAN
jgi:hypothetical protein